MNKERTNNTLECQATLFSAQQINLSNCILNSNCEYKKFHFNSNESKKNTQNTKIKTKLQSMALIVYD